MFDNISKWINVNAHCLIKIIVILVKPLVTHYVDKIVKSPYKLVII